MFSHKTFNFIAKCSEVKEMITLNIVRVNLLNHPLTLLDGAVR